jgi:hypothetical protein
MSEFDEETVGACSSTSTAEYDAKMEDYKEDRFSVSITSLTNFFVFLCLFPLIALYSREID